MDSGGTVNNLYPHSQGSQFGQINADYSHINSSGMLNNNVTQTQDSRGHQQTIKTYQTRCQDAQSSFSNQVIFNTMNNQKVPSQSKNRELNIQRDISLSNNMMMSKVETLSNGSNRKMHRRLHHVEPSSTHLSANRSSKSVGSMINLEGHHSRMPSSNFNNRRNMSDNVSRQHKSPPLSQNSRSNFSDDRTTRRSISDIRQRYCQLKQQEVENEWRIQDARDKIEAKKFDQGSPTTQDLNFDNNDTSGKREVYNTINASISPTNKFFINVNSNSGSFSKVTSANKIDNPNQNLGTNFNTMLNSQYIQGDENFMIESRENRPFQRISVNETMHLPSYNGTMVKSVTDTIQTQDLSQTIHDTGKLDITSGYRNVLSNNESLTEIKGYTEYFSVGAGSQGQLGRPHKSKDPSKCFLQTPKSLSFDILIKQVSCGGSHVLLLSASNELFTFGSNSHGQLGLNDKHFPFSTAPLLVQPVKRIQGRILSVKAGGKHNLMLIDTVQTEKESAGHDLYSWGSNQNGECAQLIKQHPILYMPFKVYSKVIRGNRIAQIDCGEGFSGILTVTGEAYTWGDNSCGQLGIGRDNENQVQVREPTKVQVNIPIQQFSLGYRHSLFLTVDYQVFGAGINKNCELGQNFTQFANQQMVFDPIPIPSLQEHGVKKVIAGFFSAVINMSNQVMIWGCGEFGTIRAPQKLFMDRVEYLDCKISKFMSINDTGDNFYVPASSAYALDANGQVYSWGSNEKGQLGQGDTRNRKLPSQILSLKRKEIRYVDVGGDFAIMLGKDVKVQESKTDLDIKGAENEQMPFNLDILNKIQEQGRHVQDAIKIRDYSQEREEQRRSEDYPKFGQSQNPSQFNTISKNDGLMQYQQANSQLYTPQDSCLKSNQHQMNNSNIDLSPFAKNDYSSVQSNQKDALMKSTVMSEGQEQLKYLITEPRAPHILPFQKGRKPEKKLRACTLPRTDVSEHMNRILSSNQGKNNFGLPKNIQKTHTDISERGNLSIIQDNSQLYHMSSGPHSPSISPNLNSKDANNDFINNTLQYIVTTNGNDMSRRHTTTPTNFLGDTALKAKRQLARDIGANLSEDSNGGDDSNPEEDLYIHKLKSQHLKKQLKKLMNHSAQQICGLQLQLKQEGKRAEQLQSNVQDLESQIREQRRKFKEELDMAEQRCSEVNIDARKKQMKCEERVKEMEQEQNQGKVRVEEIRVKYESRVREMKHEFAGKEQAMKAQIEIMQQRITHYEKTLKDQTILINRYKGIDIEKTQLVGRLQGLEQENIKWQRDHERLENECQEFQKALEKMEEDLEKQKKSTQKQEAAYRSEKAKRKEIVQERDKEKEKLRVEREQTKSLNNEILQIKMQYNELDAQKLGLQTEYDMGKKETDNQIEQLKNEIAVVQKAMEEQKKSFEQQIVTITQSKVADIGQLHQEIQNMKLDKGEADRKNEELQRLLSDKSQHLETILSHVKNECIEKSAILDDNERLDDIINRLEHRNKELSNMLGEQAFKQAEDYKKKLFSKLTGEVARKSSYAGSKANTDKNSTWTSNNNAKSHDPNQFTSILQDLASTQKLENKLSAAPDDKQKSSTTLQPANQEQAQSITNFNINSVSNLPNVIHQQSSLENMVIPQQQYTDIKEAVNQYRNGNPPLNYKYTNLDREVNNINQRIAHAPGQHAPGYSMTNITETNGSVRGCEKVPTTSVSELSPPMISSNQNRNGRFAQNLNQHHQPKSSHGGMNNTNVTTANATQSLESNKYTISKSQNSSIERTSPERSRSSSIKRVEQAQNQEKEMRMEHQIRQNMQQNAYDQLIQQIYAENQKSFLHNSSVRSIVEQKSTSQLLQNGLQQLPMHLGSLNQLQINQQRSSNKTPQFEGSQISSLNHLIGTNSSYQTIAPNMTVNQQNHSLEQILPQGLMVKQQNSNEEQRRMKSLDVCSRQSGGHAARNKLRLNRLQLDESFNKIEHLLRQTKDLQEQTQQLKSSSSSQLQNIRNTRKYSHDPLSQDVGPPTNWNSQSNFVGAAHGRPAAINNFPSMGQIHQQNYNHNFSTIQNI